MLMKSINLYRVNRDFKIDLDTLADKLGEFQFSGCTGSATQSIGWSKPKLLDELFYNMGDCSTIVFFARKQVRNVPASVINDALRSQLDAYEKQGVVINRKQRAEIKDDLATNLLSRAFPRDTYITLMYFANRKQIVVDGSERDAEDALALLRKTLGSLPCVPFIPEKPVEDTLTEMVQTGDYPTGFNALGWLTLESTIDNSKATYTNQNLTGEELDKNISENKMVTKMAFDWQDRISFSIDDGFRFTSIKFADDLKDEFVSDTDTYATDFDATMYLMNSEFRALITDAVEVFGKPLED